MGIGPLPAFACQPPPVSLAGEVAALNPRTEGARVQAVLLECCRGLGPTQTLLRRHRELVEGSDLASNPVDSLGDVAVKFRVTGVVDLGFCERHD